MPFRRFFERRRRGQAANALYHALVGQARQPAFYVTHGVPDTLEGRYDMVVLHAYLLMRRLGNVNAAAAEAAKALSQATFDLMFADMDQSLREMGVTDTRIGKRVRRMAEAFFGRVAAYDRAQAEGGEALCGALARNLYNTVTPAPQHLTAMAAYVLAQQDVLAGQSDDDLLAGKVTFSTLGDAA